MLTCSLLRLLRKITNILELKQNRFLGRGGGSMAKHNWGTDTFRKMWRWLYSGMPMPPYNRKILGVDLECGRKEVELNCTRESRCSFIIGCLNRDLTDFNLFSFIGVVGERGVCWQKEYRLTPFYHKIWSTQFFWHADTRFPSTFWGVREGLKKKKYYAREHVRRGVVWANPYCFIRKS